ncbi:hypothetical protein R6Q59_007475 [Mikania micrantha]
MEFVAVDAATPVPLMSENVVLPSPERSLLEELSSTDDDSVPLAKMLKGKAAELGESSKSGEGAQRVPLRFCICSHTLMQSSAEASSSGSPVLPSKHKASTTVIREEEEADEVHEVMSVQRIFLQQLLQCRYRRVSLQQLQCRRLFWEWVKLDLLFLQA